MKFMSLFSGIGGFDLGLERAGMECVAQADNDPFCNKVLAKHWPGVTRYDDVRLIRYEGLRSLQNREALDGVSSSAEGGTGTALMVRPVLQCVLQGSPPTSNLGAAHQVEPESALRAEPCGLQRDEARAAEPLRDMRGADGATEGGSRPLNGRGTRAVVPSLQPAVERDRGRGLLDEGDALPPFADLIVGGFPCQDLSVAGLRRGLAGSRSYLFFEFMRIVREMREASNGRFPTAVIAENVPGLFSSASGRDFGVVINALAECGAVDIGWRVIDSQHWVPQRRRRVFIVAVFPPQADGRSANGRASEILSLCESGDWNTQARRAQGEDVAATIRGRSSSAGVNEPGRGGEDDSNLVLAATLTSGGEGRREHRGDDGTDTLLLANTLPGHHPQQDLDNDTYIPTVGHQVQTKHRSDFESETLVTHSLRADGFDASEDGTGRGTPLVVRTAQTGANGIGVQDDMAYTLDGTDGQAIAWEQRYVRNGRGAPSEIVPPLKARSGEDGRGDSAPMVGVRRLTPVECERLQGFPDNWSQLDDKTADGPRYKALGNAVTVPVIEYIGRRIVEVMR